MAFSLLPEQFLIQFHRIPPPRQHGPFRFRLIQFRRKKAFARSMAAIHNQQRKGEMDEES
jgi:hypothetical protein